MTPVISQTSRTKRGLQWVDKHRDFDLSFQGVGDLEVARRPHVVPVVIDASTRRRLSDGDIGAIPEASDKQRGDPVLSVTDLHLWFGGVRAIEGVDFRVSRGDIFSIIGPNGAGKTSLLNVISGVYKPTTGSIAFEGNDCTKLRPQFLAKLGIARTFQNVALFKGMSVLENILTGRHIHMKSDVFSCGFFWGPTFREEVQNRHRVEQIIEFLEIKHLRSTPADALPYGLQKRVELGRALALEPKLLLLDEPMAGMNHDEKRSMVRYVLNVNKDFGTTIILIEHDMNVVMDISHRVMVLDHGVKIAEGTPHQVRENADVIRAYLGTPE